VTSPKARLAWAGLFFLVLSVLTIPAAYAYVDPGTGSYVFQVLIGVFLGAAVALKLWWRRLWAFVTRKRPPERESAPTSHDETS
jgi:hypothetical protein